MAQPVTLSPGGEAELDTGSPKVADKSLGTTARHRAGRWLRPSALAAGSPAVCSPAILGGSCAGGYGQAARFRRPLNSQWRPRPQYRLACAIDLADLQDLQGQGCNSERRAHLDANTGHTRCMNQPRSTVSAVGAGHVGSAVANALVLLRVCDQVLLYDRDLALAEGEAWDIADTVPLL